jgi:hypothetical protein
VLLPHLQELGARWRRRRAAPVPPARPDTVEGLPPGRSWRFTLVAATVAWVAFALSPAGAPMVQGDRRTPDQLYGQTVPVAAAEYLRKHPPPGLVLSPQWWGDWLVQAGPPGLQPFVTSDIHAIPPSVWRDYLRFSEARPGWMEVLDRYLIETLVLDKREQTSHIQSMRKLSNWRVVFEDAMTFVAIRTAAPTVAPGS